MAAAEGQEGQRGMQRVNEASFFEVTSSRSCEDVNGFHNAMFDPGGKAIISCSVFW